VQELTQGCGRGRGSCVTPQYLFMSTICKIKSRPGRLQLKIWKIYILKIWKMHKITWANLEKK
jgi:hypothetical protein